MSEYDESVGQILLNGAKVVGQELKAIPGTIARTAGILWLIGGTLRRYNDSAQGMLDANKAGDSEAHAAHRKGVAHNGKGLAERLELGNLLRRTA